MSLSGNAIRKLGKRLRDGDNSDEDITLLEEYRASFDPLLVQTSLELDQTMRNTALPYLISGRSKRTKSIIRKLRRPANYGMDLSRMSDLVGLRLLVESRVHQEQALSCISKVFEVKDIDDYRSDGRESGYRSIHIIIRDDRKFLEVQLRTLAQHLWATESESFGEKTKEGSGDAAAAEYLAALAHACAKLDDGLSADEKDHPSPFMVERRPLTGIYPGRVAQFQNSLRSLATEATSTYLIVFDRIRGELLHAFAFGGNQREEAVCEYARLCRSVDQAKMDVLIINSPTRLGIEVTHPQFF